MEGVFFFVWLFGGLSVCVCVCVCLRVCVWVFGCFVFCFPFFNAWYHQQKEKKLGKKDNKFVTSIMVNFCCVSVRLREPSLGVRGPQDWEGMRPAAVPSCDLSIDHPCRVVLRFCLPTPTGLSRLRKK